MDVSKLSGRLKSNASCPVERRAFEAGGMRAGRWESVNGGACKRRRGSGWGSGGRVRAERTLNMLSMVVTRDVSKLSDWLNALASCGAAGEGW